MAPAAAPSPFATSDELLHDLLAVSLTGVIFYSPVYDPAGSGEVVDFAFDYLNPAAQRMMQMPERPTLTHTEQWPQSKAHGTFAFHVDAFVSGEPRAYEVNYQADGHDNYYRLAARRSGRGLLVSFTDTADQPRTAVEVALRESQAREQAARAEVEQQREELRRLFEQAPVALAAYRGPRYEVELANPEVLRLWGRTAAQALGTPLFELLPEISGQGFKELLDQVMATGEPHVAHEMPSTIARDGRRDTVYWNFGYQPLREADGRITGVTVVATEVTEQVVARRQLEQLNQELEARVFERTQALRHAQAGAEAAAQRLRHVTDSLPSTSFVTDQHGQVLSVSPQWYAYTGMAPGTPINEAWPTLIHPDDLPAIAQEYGAALAEGRPWRYEFRLRGAAGQYRWFASQGQPEPLAEAEAAGRPRQWFGSNLDIDDLKQAQHAQQQQEQQLANILTALPAGVVTFAGEELRYSFFNDTFQQRVQGRAVLGRTVAELFPEAEAQGYLEQLRGVLRTAEPYRAHEALAYVQDPRTGERQETFLDLAYLPLRHGQAPPHAVLAFSLDVTERVRARREREAQRQRLHDLFMQAPAAICILDGPDLVFELVNPGYQALLPGRALHGRSFAAALPELAGHAVHHAFRTVYETGVTHEEKGTLVPLARPDGTLEDRYFNYIQQARFDAHGQPDGVLIFAFEVTEQVRARQQAQALAAALAAANDQLTRTNVDLDTFVYTASHDLKTPIANIEGLLATLRDELPAAAAPGEVPYILDLMQGSVERFQHTIDHLTDISKLQKEYDQPAQPVPLAPVIEGVRLDLAPLLQQTGGCLDVDVRAVPTLTFSEKNLRSVVFNLLSNALKYRHPDRPPRVRVRARLEGDFAVLEVQDNGLGFDVGREAQLFAMFQRLHTHVEGSGVGLYMVKRLVENAGGRIAVVSTVGEGTTFAVSLPR